MKAIVAEASLVAYCGLYCGACRAYLRGRCPGCQANEQARWCQVRSCCRNQDFASCADCKEFPDPMACKKFNNAISKVFAVLFRSDRAACIRQIRDSGIDGHAKNMAESQRHTIRR